VKAVKKVRCPVGEARITLAGNLPSKYVIHTVGPRYHREAKPQELLAMAYNNSLELALENGCESIAFPAISCGSYGYPVREAAKIAVHVCSDDRFNNIEIFFYLYGQKNYAIWQSVLDQKLT
jgi:O-acetyl-ADP-ribose deacetylase (regulator of RNase III)